MFLLTNGSKLSFIIPVFIELHAELNDESVEVELLSRWKNIGFKMSQGESLESGEWDELHRIKEELERVGIYVVHCRKGNSIHVCLYCSTDVSLVRLQEMINDNRLHHVLVSLFKCLMPKRESLQLKLRIESEQFEQAKRYFMAPGNNLHIFSQNI